MGKGSGSVRQAASRAGLRVTKLSDRQSSGGKYKYAIRGGNTNMRAANLKEARSLIRSVVDRKRGRA